MRRSDRKEGGKDGEAPPSSSGDNTSSSKSNDKDRSPDSRTGSGTGSGSNGASATDKRRSSTSPSGGSGSGSRSPHSPKSPGSGHTGSPRDLSPPLLQELATMNVRELAPRPNVGSAGRASHVRANFYEMRLPSNAAMIIMYRVDIKHPNEQQGDDPGRKGRKMDRDEYRLVFWKMVAEFPQYFPNKYCLAYDGMNALYSTKTLPFPESRPSIALEFDCSLPKDTKPTTPMSVSLAQVSTCVMDISKVRSNMLDDRTVTPVQILDIILRQNINLASINERSMVFYPFKSSFYRIPTEPGTEAMDLGGGKQLWAGFFTSVTIASAADQTKPARALLNVDVSHTAFFKPRVSMIEFMIDALNEKAGGGGMGGGGRGGRGGGPRGGGRGGYGGPPAPSAGPYNIASMNAVTKLALHEMKVVDEAVKSLRIRVQQDPNVKARVYKILKVVDSADSLSFEVDDRDGQGKRRMTVAEYFSEKYRPLQYPKLPCLHVGSPARNIYFPIEVCHLDWPVKYPRKLNDQMTAMVIRATATPAPQREQKINSMIAGAQFGNDPFLKEFGIAVSNQMVELKGRVLQPPNVIYNERSRVPRVTPNEGAWDSINQVMLVPATCHSYSLIALVPQRDEQSLQDFCQKLYRKAGEMGLGWPQWPVVVKYARSKEDISPMYNEIMTAHANTGTPCDMVFVIMPARNTDVYMAVKECSDIVHGVMSQCLLFKNASRFSPATASNVLLKVNTKLGGINNKLEADQVSSKYLTNCSTLVLGIDVTHPTVQEEKAGIPSIAAVVGNIDMLPQKWGANLKVQKKSRESVVYLLDSVRERLVSFYKTTGRKPERIIVYRDGVSDGQFMEVLREEMQGIRTACLMLSPEYRPPITYIVVQKRHHVRFFPGNPREATGKARNVAPGLVVDTDVVAPESFDFFLCSHFGIQGTSRPTRYCCLWDECKFKADELQLLTYQLCHMYCRCPRSVSIPAPVYYADLVATRARCHVKRKLGFASDSQSDSGRNPSTTSGATSQSRISQSQTSQSSVQTGTTAATGSTVKGADAKPRGRGKAKKQQPGPSGDNARARSPQSATPSEYGSASQVGGTSGGSSDSGLQDCVTVTDNFKQRMYFV